MDFLRDDSFQGLDIAGLMADRDGLTATHVAKLYTTDFKNNVIGRNRIPDPIWKQAKSMVVKADAVAKIKEYINKRITEEKEQPASPASSSGKKGKGLTRIITKAKAKSKARTAAASFTKTRTKRTRKTPYLVP